MSTTQQTTVAGKQSPSLRSMIEKHSGKRGVDTRELGNELNANIRTLARKDRSLIEA